MRLLIDASPRDINLSIKNADFKDSKSHVAPFRVVNIGNSKPISLLDYVKVLTLHTIALHYFDTLA